MLDRSGFWPAPPNTDTILEGDGLTVRLLPPVPQVMVSGNLEKFLSAHDLGPTAGLLGQVAPPHYALRLARHRMLAVGIPQDHASAGWADGVATTPMTGALAVLDISGENGMALIARATAIDPRSGSPSAALTFAGVQAALCRQGNDLRLHVDRGLVSFLFDWIRVTSPGGSTH
jgi:hypothetical protein